MKKKSKGETIELLYTNSKEKDKKTKNKKTKTKEKNVGETSSRLQKGNINKTINLDNEIIIGLTPKKEVQTNKKEQTRGKTKKKSNKSTSNNSNLRKNKTKSKNNKSNIKKNKAKSKIIKWTCIIILITVTVVLFMMSSVFNIKQIIVLNNNKISSEEIINLSTLKIGENMFKTTNRTIEDAIKTNPYVEQVKIKRNINSTITLEIKERVPTYMLKFANAYVYINNQGYMLEVVEEPLKVPVITDFITPTETIEVGNRLVVEDLKKLDDIIKIVESARSNSLAEKITEINISDSSNYILKIKSEKKIVQFGDITNINTKILKIEEVIEQEKGIEGEIYFQDSEKTVFREEVKR